MVAQNREPATAGKTVFLALALAGVAGCGTTAPARSVQAPAPPRAESEEPVHEIDVTAAALPFAILDARGGREIPLEQFLTELGQDRAICIGEGHTEIHDHWAQLHLLDLLSRQNQAAGITTGLGFEMFQRPVQGVLDDYQAGRIDEATMLERTGWKQRWGFPFAFYRPMIDLAVKRGVALVALNTARELIKKVTKHGVAGLDPVDRAKLPAEIVLDDPEHRAWFAGVMEEMGGAAAHSGSAMGGKPGAHPPKLTPEQKAAAAAKAKELAERIYNSQVVWDETMADTAARWVEGGDKRQIIILAGAGHCHDSAIVRRMKRRGVERVVSVQPVVDDGGGETADLLAEPRNDYLFVMTAGAEKVATPGSKKGQVMTAGAEKVATPGSKKGQVMTAKPEKPATAEKPAAAEPPAGKP